MVQLLGYGISQLTKPFSFSDDTPGDPGRIGKNGQVASLFAAGLELRGDFVIRVVHEHLDIGLAVSRGSAVDSAFGDPERKLVANITSAGDFVLVYRPDNYWLFG
jgi:hypothetical protein